MVRRYYFAITNACNRACDLCSCYSRPGKKTFLDFERYKEILPAEGRFEIQLEGGEPFLHPKLEDMIFHAQNTGRCDAVTVGTNAVLLPYAYTGTQLDANKSIDNIKNYFLRFSPFFILKPSINYHLISKDPHHLDKAELLRDSFFQLQKNGRYELKFNVRRRKKSIDKNAFDAASSDNEDEWLLNELKRRGLYEISNIFFYQRYGFAGNRTELDPPFIIPNPVEFYLISPDGLNWGTDLIARSEGMKNLP